MRMEEWQRTHLPHSKGIMQDGEMLQTIELDRGCFTCMLGGADRKALFIEATGWKGAEENVSNIEDEQKTFTSGQESML